MPDWIEPQLAALVKAAPEGDAWLHEITLDGYRMHARLDAGAVSILTRRGNRSRHSSRCTGRQLVVVVDRLSKT